MKEGLALNIQLYYEDKCQVLVPTKEIESAIYNGDPKKVFQRCTPRDIKNYMAMIFDNSMNGDGMPSRNPYVFVEKCSLQFHIFSYRLVDFPQLFNFLNHNLNRNDNKKQMMNGKKEDKTPRYNDHLNDIFNDNDRKTGKM